MIVTVLDNEEDDEGHTLALQITQDLVKKDQDTFLEQYARLGITAKVLGLAGPPTRMTLDGEKY